MAAAGLDTDHSTTTTTRLTGVRLLAIRAVLGIVVLALVLFFGYVLATSIRNSQTGATGMVCRIHACDAAGGIELVVIPGSPAGRAGLSNGDVLLAVNGTDVASVDVRGRPLSAGIEQLAEGEAGTALTVTIRRPDGSTADVTFTREAGWSSRWLVGLRYLGAPTGASVALIFIVDVVLWLGYAVPAFVMFGRKTDDWLAMFAGVVLIAGGNYMAPSFLSGGWAPETWLSLFYISFLMILLLILLLVFPDGRPVPRWGWILVAGDMVWRLIHTFVMLPRFNWVNEGFLPDLPIFAIVLAAQVYRYRNISSPVRRQQTKWVVAAFVVVVALRFMAALASLAAMWATSDFMADILVNDAAFLISGIGGLVLPLAMMFALLRYRLWDIDFVINRSLAYGALSLLLIGVLAGGFFALRAALDAVLGPQHPAIALVISTAIVVALFQPGRAWLRRFVDRRLYGIELDYQKGLRERAALARMAGQQAETQQTFGSYTGLELLGRGGMGEVYRAKDTKTGHDVAIKILALQLLADETAHRRFVREAETIASLAHPNIVRLYDYGEQDGMFYMVMEYVAGRDLNSILKERGSLPLHEALPLLKGIAAALDYAHTQGIVHRDIKPSNVLVEGLGGARPRAVLMDFGIAKIYASTLQLTGTGVIGTLDYISPEQIRGAHEVDARADVYSLGVMTYQVLTGELPYRLNNPGAMIMAHLLQPPPDPTDLAPELSYKAGKAIRWAMAKEPEGRFATAGEFINALGDA